jgi:hypothetical protein
MSHNFPIQNNVKEGDALSPLLFKFALEYVNRKARENQVGPNQLLIYANDVNLLADNIVTIKKTLNDASKEVV